MSLSIFDTAYISGSCNLTPCSTDWGRNNLIAYGTCNATALYDTKKTNLSVPASKFSDCGKVVCTIHTNNARVNAVCWIRTPDCSPEQHGVSGSSDGKVVVWNRSNDQRYELEGHTMTVTVVDAMHLTNPDSTAETWDTIIVSASADSTVKIWRRIDEDLTQSCYKCVQTLSLGYSICLSLRLCQLPETQSLLLACATDDSRVQLYVESRVAKQDGGVDGNVKSEFVKVDTLSGHEDWVRALDFTQDDRGDVLLASGSQDSTVRLWRIAARSAHQLQVPAHERGPLDEIEAEERVFEVSRGDGNRRHFAVSLESVLSGHEGWIYGVCWQPPVVSQHGDTRQYPMKLLTCSMDKTMIVWTQDPEFGVWIDAVRVGDVGGNTLGFYGCKFAPDGGAILAHGYQGAFHVWNYVEASETWEPGVVCGGHFREVVDVGWDPRGEFLLSAGADQTTRLHAPWAGAEEGAGAAWYEIARPQVHGFDMTCLAVISRNVFASGAEEKVIRAFAAPRNFVDNIARISRVTIESESCSAQGASVPSLGLSNKAVYEHEGVQGAASNAKDQSPEGYFTAVDLTKPPTEDVLLQNTLWPEIQKLYGHGYEIYALAARRDGRLLASACKATTSEHAAIILWETDTWQEVQRLPSHTLTVTQLAFSPDHRRLLSVSRDRCWSLFLRNAPSVDTYTLCARSDKTTGVHTRIIWCCAWTHDSTHFATGSREGRVVVWAESSVDTATATGRHACRSTFVPLKDDSVTAIAFAPDTVAGKYVAAVGTDSGIVLVYKWGPEEPERWTECARMDRHRGHHLTVKRVTFRPVFGVAGEPEGSRDERGVLQLASCGSDHAVKIYNIYLDRL